MNDHAVLVAVLRSDLRSFIWKCFQTILPGTPYLRNWHVDAIVHQLMRVQAGEISRLLINQPPRSLKSICVSVAYVAWLLGHDPTRRIIVVSYSNEFAAELHRQFRMVIDAPWYRASFQPRAPQRIPAPSSSPPPAAAATPPPSAARSRDGELTSSSSTIRSRPKRRCRSRRAGG